MWSNLATITPSLRQSSEGRTKVWRAGWFGCGERQKAATLSFPAVIPGPFVLVMHAKTSHALNDRELMKFAVTLTIKIQNKNSN
jgi:hypothetical protein